MKRRRILVSALVAGLFVAIAGVWLALIIHFNPLTGVYTYDPRTDQPSQLLLANRPDLVFVDVLTKQIERDGTYPPYAKATVVRVEPIRVAVSTYTDFQAYAFVTTRLDDADGTSRVEEFRFQSVSSEGISLPVVSGITYHAYFARLGWCKVVSEEPAGKSVCGIQ
jgi:hypothetical protein